MLTRNENSTYFVAYFDKDILKTLVETKDISAVGTPDLSKDRPWACICDNDSNSVWIELTTEKGSNRLQLLPSDFEVFPEGWGDKKVYVNAHDSIFYGPKNCFERAANDTGKDVISFNRAKLNREGLNKIEQLIANNSGTIPYRT